MREIFSKIFPSWVYWAAFLFTIAGVIYSIGNNRPWIGFFCLAPLLIAALDAAVRTHAANVELKQTVQKSQANIEDVQQKLQNISSEHLIRIQEVLMRGSIDECFDFICGFTAYISRLKQLTNSHFDIRDVFMAGESLYVAAKVPEEALQHLREDDPFLMYVKRSGMDHPIAKLRLHQVNASQKAIFLQVVSELDEPTVSSLRGLVQTASARGLKDFTMSPEISAALYKEHDMEAVTKVLGILRSSLIKNN